MATLGDQDDWVAEALAKAFFGELFGESDAESETAPEPAADGLGEEQAADEQVLDLHQEPNVADAVTVNADSNNRPTSRLAAEATASNGTTSGSDTLLERRAALSTSTAPSTAASPASAAPTTKPASGYGAYPDVSDDHDAGPVDSEIVGDAAPGDDDISDDDHNDIDDIDDIDDLEVRGSSAFRSLIEWVVVLVGAVVVALLLRAFLVHAYFIPSESMESTLMVDDRVLVNKLSYRLHDVNRGDVVVFSRPDNEDAEIKDLIKRVIGLEGDTVQGRDNQIFINDQPLEEPYLAVGEVINDFGPVTVEPGHLFVMGDNRDESADSRFFGTIDEERVIGRAFVLFWPLNRIGTL